MSYLHLPSNWTHTPLIDAFIAADLVDLYIPPKIRGNNTLMILPCREDHSPYPTPFLFQGFTWDVPPPKREYVVKRLLCLGFPSYLVGISSAEKIDMKILYRWYYSVFRHFMEAQVDLVGFFMATPHTVFEVLRDGLGITRDIAPYVASELAEAV